MPVWILTQGQNVPHKLLPKSKRKAYIGYNDGSDSILYYSVKSRKILASHNHKNLSPMPSQPSPEPIVVTPEDIPPEREDSGEGNGSRGTGNIDNPKINGKRPIGAVEIPNEENK